MHLQSKFQKFSVEILKCTKNKAYIMNKLFLKFLFQVMFIEAQSAYEVISPNNKLFCFWL